MVLDIENWLGKSEISPLFGLEKIFSHVLPKSLALPKI